jgi:tRNA1(Val) A37 N6-methylase TrmN6
MVLVEGSKNGRPGLKILPPMYTHNNDGSYTDSVMNFFEG